jgi:Sec-independent protein translocase protein TatA
MDSIDWSQIPSDVAVIGAFIWGITKGLPKLVETFKEELQRQRDEFRDEQRVTREHHERVLNTANESVNRLSESVDKVAETVDRMHSTFRNA